MELSVRKGNLEQESCDVLVLCAFHLKKESKGVSLPIDTALNGLLEKVMDEERFRGEYGQTIFVRTEGLIAAKRVLVVGLGKKEELTLEIIREAAAAAFQIARSIKTKRLFL